MLNVEILSALKKANFPLKRLAFLLSEIGLAASEDEYAKLFPNAIKLAGKWYLEPTLDQFFAALAHNFRLLERTGSDKITWTAMNTNKVGRGETPLEALANLFLEVTK